MSRWSTVGPLETYFIRNTLATMKYGGKYGGPNQTGARNSWHFATKFHRDESNSVAQPRNYAWLSRISWHVATKFHAQGWWCSVVA
jgi:hypothetical protein